MNNIDSNTFVCRQKDVITSEIDGELVMMSIETGQYIGLNAVGSRIWQLLEQPVQIDDLIKSLTDEFEVDHIKCKNEVLEYMNELNNCKLIILNYENN